MTVNPLLMPRSGRIPYLSRAAMQDSHEAMMGDVVRAVVELVLNSDDSYERLTQKGVIWIAVDRTRRDGFSRLLVGDAAEGMSADVVANKLLAAGARASGHREGRSVRGLHGRGAKDVAAFGYAVFETIHDGKYSTVKVLPDLSYDELELDRDAKESDYRRLRLEPGGNGTLVAIYVERPRFLIPRQQNLSEKLRRHYQLRDVMRDPARDVWLYDLGSGGGPILLRYEEPAAREVKALKFKVPGYPGADGALEVRRCEQKLEEDRTNQRQGGILVVGRRAIYDCTYFGLEGRSGSLYFVGRLKLPYIDQLQDEYDDVEERGEHHSPSNPTPLVTRRREGLNHQHPFYVALKPEIDRVLRPLVEQEEAGESERRGDLNENTRRRLRDAARELGRLFEEIAREEEVDVTPEVPDDERTREPQALQVIPETNRLQPGETKGFTVRAWPATFENGSWPNPPIAKARITDTQVATVTSDEIELVEDPRQAGRWRGTVRVTAGSVQDATFLEVTLGPQSAPAIVEVAEPEIKTPAPPERLSFDDETVSVKLGGMRHITLRSPAALVESNNTLVVRDVPTVFKATVGEGWHREESSGVHWYERPVQLEGTGLGNGRIRAELGSALATARVNVGQKEGALPFNFDVQDRAPQYESSGRAEWSTIKGLRTLVVLAGHSSLKRYFGEELKDQDTPLCQALVAEVIADALATESMSRKEQARGEPLFRDSQGYSTEHKRLMARYLTLAHKVLVKEPTR